MWAWRSLSQQQQQPPSGPGLICMQRGFGTQPSENWAKQLFSRQPLTSRVSSPFYVSSCFKGRIASYETTLQNKTRRARWNPHFADDFLLIVRCHLHATTAVAHSSISHAQVQRGIIDITLKTPLPSSNSSYALSHNINLGLLFYECSVWTGIWQLSACVSMWIKSVWRLWRWMKCPDGTNATVL